MIKKGIALVLLIASLAMAAEVYQIPPKSVNVRDVAVTTSNIESLNTFTYGLLKAADIGFIGPTITAYIVSDVVDRVTFTGTPKVYKPFELYVDDINLMNISGVPYPLSSGSLDDIAKFTASFTENVAVNTNLLFPSGVTVTADNVNVNTIQLSDESASFGPITMSITQGKLVGCPIIISSDTSGTFSAGQSLSLGQIIQILQDNGYTIDNVTVSFTAISRSGTSTEVTIEANVTGNTISLSGVGTDAGITEHVTIQFHNDTGTYTLTGFACCQPTLIIDDGSITIDCSDGELKAKLNDVELDAEHAVRFDIAGGRVYLPLSKTIDLSCDNVLINATLTGESYIDQGWLEINKDPVTLLASLTQCLCNQPLSNGTNVRTVDNLFIVFSDTIIGKTGQGNIVFYTDQAPPIYASVGATYVPPMTLSVKPTDDIRVSVPGFSIVNPQVVTNGNGTIYLAPVEVILPQMSANMTANVNASPGNTTVSVTVPPSTATVSVVNKIPSVALLAPLAEAFRRIRKSK